MNENCSMVAGITGESVVDIDALDAMLDWFLPEECLLLIAAPPTPGTDRIIEWCEDVKQPYITTQEYIPEAVYNYGDPELGGSDMIDLAVIVLGVEGRSQIIYDTWNRGIEVYDLTRAMYPVTQGDDLDLVVYEPETQSHEVSDGLGGRGSLDIFAPEDGSESLTEASDIPWPGSDDPELSQKELVRRLKSEMAGLVKAHEERYHSSLAPFEDNVSRGFAIADPDRTDTDSGQAGGSLQPVQMNDLENKIRCIKNKDGKIKVSPRAKPKANEEVIWLTKEEVDQLED